MRIFLLGVSTLLVSSCGASAAGPSAVEADVRVCQSQSEGASSLQACIFSIDYYKNVSAETVAECFLYSQYLSVKTHLEYARPELESYEEMDVALEKASFEKEFWSMFYQRQNSDPMDSLLKKPAFVTPIIVGMGGDPDGSRSSLYPAEAAPKAYKKYKKCTRFSEPVFNVMVRDAVK